MTSIPYLYNRLEALKSDLSLCEKALAEYLETKRLAFPRFYFVSSADLLDILSNGNNPSLVVWLRVFMKFGKMTPFQFLNFFKSGCKASNEIVRQHGKVEIWTSEKWKGNCKGCKRHVEQGRRVCEPLQTLWLRRTGTISLYSLNVLLHLQLFESHSDIISIEYNILVTALGWTKNN